MPKSEIINGVIEFSGCKAAGSKAQDVLKILVGRRSFVFGLGSPGVASSVAIPGSVFFQLDVKGGFYC